MGRTQLSTELTADSMSRVGWVNEHIARLSIGTTLQDRIARLSKGLVTSCQLVKAVFVNVNRHLSMSTDIL